MTRQQFILTIIAILFGMFAVLYAGLAFAIDLRGTPPEEATMAVTVDKPAGATEALVTITGLDIEQPEGELIVNGGAAIALFPNNAANNNQVADVVITMPAEDWVDGANTLLFRHTATQGYRIDAVSVMFTGAPPAAPPTVEQLPTTINLGWPVFFKVPQQRADGTPLALEEIAKYCMYATTVDTDGRESSLSTALCKTPDAIAAAFAEYAGARAPVEQWVVADNFWSDTRPVYDAMTHENVADQRAPEGDPCGDQTRPDQTGSRQWRAWGEDYEVYCERVAP